MPVVVILLWLFPMTVLFLIYRISTAHLRRREQERAVIAQLATVIEQDLPLARALAIAADGERLRARRILKQISDLLCEGLPLSAAVERGFLDCPGVIRTLIDAGERAGQLPAALDQARQWLNRRSERRIRFGPAVLSYVFVMLTCLLMVSSFVLIFLLPKFKDIFNDFNVQLPRKMAFFVEHGPILLQGLGALIIGMIAIAVVTLYVRFRPRHVPVPGVLSQMADEVRWRIPGWRRVEFAEGMTVMLRTLRFGIGAGLPLERAAELAAGLDVNVHLRLRMTRFARLLAEGQTARGAARDARLGQVAAIALAAGERGGDLDPALRYAADYYEALVSRWWIALSSLAVPLTTLAMGILIGTTIYTFFQPLVALINSVMAGGW
ncbi:MAG TPA: type II secretion system F family protein [Phycisphaerae bacterium]|jgi:type II secretory pathway component PulF